MRQHRSFWVTRRARGEDDLGEIVWIVDLNRHAGGKVGGPGKCQADRDRCGALFDLRGTRDDPQGDFPPTVWNGCEPSRRADDHARRFAEGHRRDDLEPPRVDHAKYGIVCRRFDEIAGVVKAFGDYTVEGRADDRSRRRRDGRGTRRLGLTHSSLGVGDLTVRVFDVFPRGNAAVE